MNIGSRSLRSGARPVTEVLECRELLSADAGAFAQFAMTGTSPTGPAGMTMHVSRSEFTFAQHGVLLGLAMQASTGNDGPDDMAMTPRKGSSGRIVLQDRHPVAGMTDVVLARVGPGSFGVQARMPGANGSMQVDVYLVGDANGDGRVNGQDLHLIRSLFGRVDGQPGYSLAADSNGDGVINMLDWLLARANIGAATKVHPLTVTAALGPTSDPDGNGVVTSPNVTIVGQTEPGATVQFDQGDTGTITQTTTADAQGRYQFSVAVGIGVTPFHVTAVDPFGQRATADLSVTRGDVIIAWNRTMLDAIRASQDTLGLSTRTLAMVQAAMYDAVNDIDHFGSVYKADVQAAPGASDVAAASEAAFVVLTDLMPSQDALYDATLAESLADVPDGPGKDAGIAVGKAVAADMMAWRADDGSEAQVPYVPGTAPGQWRPTPPDYSVAWGPEWGQVTPFVIPSTAPFLPPPPPALDSPEYASALNEVESLGAQDSTTRTPEQTQIGDFWAYDVAGEGPPPVLFNEITETIALQQHNTLDQDARLFALIDTAISDAGIVAWETKFTDNRWRPITAIRDAGDDGNPATVADPSWTPLGSPGDGIVPNFTPNFPSYVSGHATFGGALFTILADFYGTDQLPFTIGSDEEPGVTRTYPSFSAAAQELADSRIYLGIHFPFDETAGLAAGDAIGNYVYQHAMTSDG